LPFRILVVDDERVLCELVARMLREAGYLVVTACHGEAGWELVSEGADSFDLVVTDSRLPGISGREFVTRLREHNPTLPIVHLTGSLRSSAGFPDNVPTLLKPFDLSKLVPTVRALLAA
jgi:two-component system, cell cycle response regulator CpdR